VVGVWSGWAAKVSQRIADVLGADPEPLCCLVWSEVVDDDQLVQCLYVDVVGFAARKVEAPRNAFGSRAPGPWFVNAGGCDRA